MRLAQIARWALNPMAMEFVRQKGTHVKTEAEMGSWKVQGGCSQSLQREQDPADTVVCLAALGN